jgi:NAD(P)-dependent dehydrogenase (short-subunit alcohol dehydrogenase family)
MKILITGATRGIGRAAALELAKQGHELVVVARDPARTGELVTTLRAGGAKVSSLLCDLSSLAEIRRLAAEVQAQHPSLDVLINNAGGMFPIRKTTVDGFELTFAVNHLAYFLLTNLLRDNIKQRVVSVSSGAHSSGRIDFDDLMGERRFGGLRNYSQSKLANILFTRELARRLTGTGVTANCLHPGFVATRFGSGNGLLTRIGVRIAMLGAITVEKGAETMVHLAAAPELADASGGYYQKSQLTQPSAPARSPDSALRLWAESARISGMAV